MKVINLYKQLTCAHKTPKMKEKSSIILDDRTYNKYKNIYLLFVRSHEAVSCSTLKFIRSYSIIIMVIIEGGELFSNPRIPFIIKIIVLVF